MSVRFAPSPTGTFHVGNLRTAWVAQQLARARKLPLHFRIEDIDTPRVVAGAWDLQRQDMEMLGIVPDVVTFQSRRSQSHWQILVQAVRSGKAYPCFCSRKDVARDLAAMASAPHGALPVYSGKCRESGEKPQDAKRDFVAWRWKSEEGSGGEDFLIGKTSNIDATGAPHREGFEPSYNWACAVDDWEEAHSLLVRAWDLQGVLKYQRGVQSWLRDTSMSSRPLPDVFHTTLITNDDGTRLEKRTRGATFSELLAVGRTRTSVLAAFQHSFEREVRVDGEYYREIPLSKLLGKV